MEPAAIIALLAFVGVGALVMTGFLFSTHQPSKQLENRLNILAGKVSREDTAKGDIMRKNLNDEDTSSLIHSFMPKSISLNELFEQADCNIPQSNLISISALLMLAGMGLPLMMDWPPYMMILSFFLGVLPWVWLFQKRKSRIAKFTSQLPEALELLARALRSGQSLAAGLQVIAQEVADPLGPEFNKVYEKQRLGSTIDDALKEMTVRVPSLDLKFFATSVAIQRQTGGDLAEILDKIGYIVRERFRILGQVQALTGEGRMSGTVLLAMPIVLFLYLRITNPSYIEPLWTTDIGKKMLAATVVMQILGAIVIKKIIDIKV